MSTEKSGVKDQEMRLTRGGYFFLFWMRWLGSSYMRICLTPDTPRAMFGQKGHLSTV